MDMSPEQTLFLKRYVDGHQECEKMLNNANNSRNENPNNNGISPSHLSEWLSSKGAKIINTDRMWGEGNLCILLMGM